MYQWTYALILIPYPDLKFYNLITHILICHEQSAITMKSSIHLITLISILISTNCQDINKTQSGSEEYIPGDYGSGDYQSGDYQSGDYYYYDSDSNQILEFANFT